MTNPADSNGSIEELPSEPYLEEASPILDTAKEAMEVTILETELTQLQKDVKEFKDKYLRVLAEAENSRKRLLKEKEEILKYAVQSVVMELLHPIDNMENALKASEQMTGEVKHWAIGFQMILAQFKEILSNHGVEGYSSEGMQFDPHRHEAVETVETEEYPDGIVIKEFVKGYRLGDRTIRPARVKVSKRPSSPEKIEKIVEGK